MMFDEAYRVFRQEQEDLFRLFKKLPLNVRDHSRIVADLTVQIFLWLKDTDMLEEIEPYEAEMIHKAVLFHDIGFSVTPARVINKVERTGADEGLYQNHTVYGGKLLELYRMRNTSVRAERNLWLLASEISVSHHERWDGKGYPYGAMTTAVPLAARIVSIANTYDDLIRGNQSGRAIPAKFAMARLADGAGTSFDPKLVEVILRKFRVF